VRSGPCHELEHAADGAETSRATHAHTWSSFIHVFFCLMSAYVPQSVRADEQHAPRERAAASLQVAGRTQTSLTSLDASHSVAFSDAGFHILLLAPSLRSLMSRRFCVIQRAQNISMCTCM